MYMKTNSISKLPLTSQILIILLLMVLPIDVLCITVSLHSQELLMQRAEENIQLVMQYHVRKLDERLDISSRYYHNLLTSGTGIELLRQKDDAVYRNAKILVSREANTSMSYDSNIADVLFFYSPALDDMLIVKSSQQLFYRPLLMNYLTENHLADRVVPWTLIEYDGLQWLIRVSQENHTYAGQMICLTHIADSVLENITYAADSIEFSDNPAATERGTRVLLFTVQSESGPYLHLRIPREEILGSLPVFIRVSFLLAILSFLMFPLLTLMLRHVIIRPLTKIGQAMQHLESAEIEYRIGPHNYPREFIQISNLFNSMADHIQDLKIRQYEEQLEQERLRTRNLELQIRPHFLLNTLNLMFSLSLRDDRKQLENTILYLADYFRSIFQRGQPLTSFSHELELIKQYIQIAEIRYPGEFEITYEIEPGTENFMIPPLLVHNFVENTMRHALSKERITHIRLASETLDGIGRITITDDGKGFPEDVVQEINGGSPSEEFQRAHVGIVNSYQRIHYYLGDTAGMHIDSEPGKGCRITIYFPYENSEPVTGDTVTAQ